MGFIASLQRMGRDRRLVRLVGLALMLRVAIIAVSVGSNDVELWAWITKNIHALGLLGAYDAIFEANHPPLAALYMSGVKAVSSDLTFPWLVKLPGLVGDMVTAALLWQVVSSRGSSQVAARRITVAYLFNPLTILLTSFHGNTDMLYVALLFSAAVALTHDRPGLAGLLYGGALNVKLLPVAFGIAFLFLLIRRGGLAKFAAATAAALTPVWTIMALRPTSAPGRMLGYQHPNPEPWGITGVELLARNSEQVIWYHSFGRGGLAIALILAAGWTAHRQLGVHESIGLAVAAFLLATPAFGVQYLAPLVPFLFVVDLRLGTVYGWVGGVSVAAAYVSAMDPWLPATAIFSEPLPPTAVFAAALTWAVVGWAAVKLGSERRDGEVTLGADMSCRFDGVPAS